MKNMKNMMILYSTFNSFFIIKKMNFIGNKKMNFILFECYNYKIYNIIYNIVYNGA
jgi:hypothetical protein